MMSTTSQFRTLLTLPLALAALMVPSAAHADDTFEPDAQDDAALVRAWEAWEAKGIEDYSTKVTLTCFCPESPVVRTVVRDGDVRAVNQGGRRVGQARGHTMDQLFLMLREAHKSADQVNVTYTSRGVPKSITIDPEKAIADEETYYTVQLKRL